ncbi:MAG: hypothetical protein V2A34_06065 [Lentisphaerota bacterium]
MAKMEKIAVCAQPESSSRKSAANEKGNAAVPHACFKCSLLSCCGAYQKHVLKHGGAAENSLDLAKDTLHSTPLCFLGLMARPK